MMAIDGGSTSADTPPPPPPPPPPVDSDSQRRADDFGARGLEPTPTFRQGVNELGDVKTAHNTEGTPPPPHDSSALADSGPVVDVPLDKGLVSGAPLDKGLVLDQRTVRGLQQDKQTANSEARADKFGTRGDGAATAAGSLADTVEAPRAVRDQTVAADSHDAARGKANDLASQNSARGRVDDDDSRSARSSGKEGSTDPADSAPGESGRSPLSNGPERITVDYHESPTGLPADHVQSEDVSAESEVEVKPGEKDFGIDRPAVETLAAFGKAALGEVANLPSFVMDDLAAAMRGSLIQLDEALREIKNYINKEQ